jgi:hypothetical protein
MTINDLQNTTQKRFIWFNLDSVAFCRSMFVLFLLSIVCPVFRFIVVHSDYHFGIFLYYWNIIMVYFGLFWSTWVPLLCFNWFVWLNLFCVVFCRLLLGTNNDLQSTTQSRLNHTNSLKVGGKLGCSKII